MWWPPCLAPQERAIQPLRPMAHPSAPAFSPGCQHQQRRAITLAAQVASFLHPSMIPESNVKKPPSGRNSSAWLRLANTACWSPQAALGMIGYLLLGDGRSQSAVHGIHSRILAFGVTANASRCCFSSIDSCCRILLLQCCYAAAMISDAPGHQLLDMSAASDCRRTDVDENSYYRSS